MNAKRVFHSVAVCGIIFEYVDLYEKVISKYQNLNKRFYNMVIPRIKPFVVLYKEYRLAISIHDDDKIIAEHFSPKLLRKQVWQKSFKCDEPDSFIII